MEHVNIIKTELEVSWDHRKLVVVLWVPFGADPNDRPRVSVYEYFEPERNQEVLVLQLLSNSWADTREPTQEPARFLDEVREFAIEKAVEDNEDF